MVREWAVVVRVLRAGGLRRRGEALGAALLRAEAFSLCASGSAAFFGRGSAAADESAALGNRGALSAAPARLLARERGSAVCH